MPFDLYSIVLVEGIIAFTAGVFALVFLRYSLRGFTLKRSPTPFYIEKGVYIALTALTIVVAVSTAQNGSTLLFDVLKKDTAEVEGIIQDPNSATDHAQMFTVDNLLKQHDTFVVGDTPVKAKRGEYYLKPNKGYRIEYYKDSGFIKEVFKLPEEDYRFDGKNPPSTGTKESTK